YEDKDILKERLEFYNYQANYTNENSKLYRINFVVRSYKNKWSSLKQDLTVLVSSEYMQCFDKARICNKQEVIDVNSRDITLYVDLAEMLRTKHSSENYFGSKILYFGDKVPDNMKEVKESFEEEEGRRVVDDN